MSLITKPAWHCGQHSSGSHSHHDQTAQRIEHRADEDSSSRCGRITAVIFWVLMLGFMGSGVAIFLCLSTSYTSDWACSQGWPCGPTARVVTNREERPKSTKWSEPWTNRAREKEDFGSRSSSRIGSQFQISSPRLRSTNDASQGDSASGESRVAYAVDNSNLDKSNRAHQIVSLLPSSTSIRSPPSSNQTFPSLQDTLELATLSWLVYSYRDYANESQVCAEINQRNFTAVGSLAVENYLHQEHPELCDLHCHWYHHNRGIGTQVLIVSSIRWQYVAIVFAGTDDLETTLTDAEIWSKPFGPDVQRKNANHSSNNDTIDYTLPDPRVRIHAGFNNAMFHFDNVDKHGDDITNNTVPETLIMTNIVTRLLDVLAQHAPNALRLLTTGHSLGAANSIMAALALRVATNNSNRAPPITTVAQGDTATAQTIAFNAMPTRTRPTSALTTLLPPSMGITSINFGCPRIGNSFYRDFVHMNPVIAQDNKVNIWRFVLGWDLVPRLPLNFWHAGHTVQIHILHNNQSSPSAGTTKTTTTSGRRMDEDSANEQARLQDLQGVVRGRASSNATLDMYQRSCDDDDDINCTPTAPVWVDAAAYYQHLGDAALGWAGVPMGWTSRPYLWVPGALESHHIHKYWHVFYTWHRRQQQQQQDQNSKSDPIPSCLHFGIWPNHFQPVPNSTSDDTNNKDDDWIDPPDDDANVEQTTVRLSV